VECLQTACALYKKKKEKKKKKKICEEAINGDTWNLEYLEPPPTTP